MAQNSEPMDVDCMDSEFDNKENSYHHSNVLPSTEKGYEELDVSELNMKLRYSITPANSPMSKSYSACVDGRNLDPDDSLICSNENANLTRSLNSTMTNDSVIKSLKSLPLQTIASDPVMDNRSSVLRQLDSTMPGDVTITVGGSHDIDESLSLPSSSSSTAHTPEATTPTNITKHEEGSPIMRGLKSVFNMFRSSQSPIPPVDNDEILKQEASNLDATYSEIQKSPTLVSAPVAVHRNKDSGSPKRNSPLKDSITFNDDLEKELQWKEDTILFSDEKIPIHKLLLPNMKTTSGVLSATPRKEQNQNSNLDSTVEYMDISYNESVVLDSTVTGLHNGGESDGEFLDCETTFTKNELPTVENNVTFKDTISEMVNKIDSKIKEDIETHIETSLKTDSTETTQVTSTNNLTKYPEIRETLSEVGHNIEAVGLNNVTSYGNDTTFFNETVNKNDVFDDENVNGGNISTIMDSSDQVPSNINSTIEIKENYTGNIVSIIPESIAVVESALPVVSSTNELSQILDNNKQISLRECESSILNDEVGQNELYRTETIEDTILSEHLEDDKDTNISTKDVNETVTIMQEVENNSNVEHIANMNSPSQEDQLKTDVTTKDVDKTVTIMQEVENETISEKIDIMNSQSQEDQLKTDITTKDVDKTVTIIQDVENEIKIEKIYCINSQSQEDQLETDVSILAIQAQFEIETENIQNQLSHEAVIIKVKDENEDKLIQPIFENIENNPDHSIVPDTLETNENTLMSDTTINVDISIAPPQNTDILNETNAIVNSLTEIIGESANNTVCMLDESLNNQMDNIECSNEIQPLPDLVHQAVSPTLIIKENEMSAQTDAIVCNAIPNTNDNILEPSLDISMVETNTKEKIKNTDLESEIKDDVVISVSEMKENVIEDISNDQKENNDVAIDDEVVLSGNNSPYVSVIAESEVKSAEESFEKVDINVTFQGPSSPPIKSKGYNFNFDEIDDPFATKTKISMSPPKIVDEINVSANAENDKKNTTIKSLPNRRRSQPPERKRSTINRKKLNTTIDASAVVTVPDKNLNVELSVDEPQKKLTSHTEVNAEDIETPENVIEAKDKIIENIVIASSENLKDNFIISENEASNDVSASSIDIIDSKNFNKSSVSIPNINEDLLQQALDVIAIAKTDSEHKSDIESTTISATDIKTSSSEHSTYYSAGSSSDYSISKNVFNLPEIDDKNFNPFATKSKMRSSPVLNESTFIDEDEKKSAQEASSPIHTPQIKDKNDEEKMDIELMEKDASYNVSTSTSSSKATIDKNLTTREVNTEDEDTEEGPFLEADDVVDNFMDLDDSNMMRFNEIAAQVIEEKADAGEMFIDAQAFEFLLNQNKCNTVADSGKESLFLKFDPLFSKRISSGGDILAALSQVKKRQSTPSKPTRPSLRNEASPIAGPSNLNSTFDAETNVTQDSIEDLNVTVAKPMMVVTPAVNAAVTPRNKTTTPPRSNRRSINFTSPAMAVIDRLLSLSGNNSLLGLETTSTQTNTHQSDTDVALTQLRELLAEKEISVYQLRSESKELKDRLSTMETQVKILESDGEDRMKKLNELNERLIEKTNINKRMAAVVEGYERTIVSLIAKTEEDKKRHNEERKRLINERDEQTAHLASMEVSFSDLHSKYEKSKQIILSCKANEETSKKSIRDFEENLAKMQANYETLKQHVTSKLNNANQELHKINKTHETEVLKLNALIKRKDMHITSLEETLAQKTKANEELTAICDELINKVG